MPTANLTDAEIPLVRDELQNDPAGKGYAQSDAAGKARLLTDRPVSQVTETVPKPMNIDAMMAHLQASSIAAISETGFDAIRERIDAGDRAGVKRWLKIALVKQQITQTEHDNVAADVDAKIDQTTDVLGDSRLMAVTGRAVGGISADEVTQVLS